MAAVRSREQQTAIYRQLARDWAAAGRPTRAPDAVRRLFAEHCQGCDAFAAGRCGECRLVVSETSHPMNLLTRSTAGCPADQPRFAADIDASELPDPLPGPATPAGPDSALELVTNYATAVKAWVAAGRPVRSRQRIAELLEVCQACDHYVGGLRPHCELCGCCTNHNAAGWVNKLAMATERCPLDPPRWE